MLKRRRQLANLVDTTRGTATLQIRLASSLDARLQSVLFQKAPLPKALDPSRQMTRNYLSGCDTAPSSSLGSKHVSLRRSWGEGSSVGVSEDTIGSIFALPTA